MNNINGFKIKATTWIELDLMDDNDKKQLEIDYRAVERDCYRWNPIHITAAVKEWQDQAGGLYSQRAKDREELWSKRHKCIQELEEWFDSHRMGWVPYNVICWIANRKVGYDPNN